MRRQFVIEGIPVDAISSAEAISGICDDVAGTEPFAVHTINLDHVVKLRRDPAFRSAYERARFVLADGFPIAFAGRLAGLDVTRTTGSDLVEPLCREAARRGLPVVFYGSTFPSLVSAASELYRRIPDLEISGVYAPGMIDVNAPAEPEGMDFIRNSGARICLIALGAPKQEILGARFAQSFTAPMAMICIGASLDFISGKETRAPRLVRTLGGEWLWRWVSSPGRMTQRYLDCFRVLPSVILSGLRPSPRRQA